MKKYSIAHVHWGFPPTIGGVETHLAILLPQLVKRGHKVSVLTGAFEGVPNEYDYKGAKVIRNILMDLNWLYKRGPGSLQKEVRSVFRDFVKKARPDIIHAHNLHYFRKEYAEALANEARKRRVPLILTAHNVWDDALFLELTRDIGWDHIIAVSHYIRRELVGIGCNPRRVTTIHHGIDVTKFKPGLNTEKIYKKYPRLKGKKVIFHPARLGLGKGCDLSIKALNIIKKKVPNTMLMMAGSKNIIDWGETQASDIAYFVDLVNHFGLQDDVIIDSYDLEIMPYLYNVCDIAVYPSTAQEPFGMTMLEALASKKPMIVTQAGGMPEIIRDGENGFVVPIKDFYKLSERIICLLLDDSLRKRLGENGYEMIINSYTHEHVTNANLEIYNKCLRNL